MGLLLPSITWGQEATEVPPQATPPPDPAAVCLAKMRGGREAQKAAAGAAQRDPALAAMRDAADGGECRSLASETRATLWAAYGLALGRADKSTEALAALRQARDLAPRDPEVRSDLAAALHEAELYEEARREAEAGLALAPSEELRKTLTETRSRARAGWLGGRLSVEASVAIAYDSNVLQGGSVETIAGRPTRSASRTATMAARPMRRSVDATQVSSSYESAIKNIYSMPTPPTTAAGVPIDIGVGVDGRLWGRKGYGLWLGYNFAQTVQLLPDQDAYNFQQHDATLRATLQPIDALRLGLSVAGFANFSGLQYFAPFQGGVAGKLTATILTGSHLRTWVLYQHKTRVSFASEDSVLNADSDELRVSEELRVRPGFGLRARLGYRLSSVRSGVLSTSVPYEVVLNPRQGTTRDLGTFEYLAPLGYMGHQASAMVRGALPAGLVVVVDGSYEYRLYDGQYSATFTPTDPQLMLPQGTIATMAVTLPAVRRLDSLVSVGVSVDKELPRGFSLALAYAYTANFSNIANSLDNRGYSKHLVTLTASYAL